MKTILLAALTLFAFQAHAELSAFEQSLQNENPIETRESVEIHNGIKYRKVESDLGIFYFKLLGRAEEISELDCQTKFTNQSPQSITMAVRVFRRSRVFIRGLQETCQTNKGQQQIEFNWGQSPQQIGIQIPDSKDSKIKDRKFQTNPFLKTPNAAFSSTY